MESAIQAHFFGQIRSTVKCRTCGYESATYEGFSHLSLELPQDNRQCSLTDCLNLYFNGESIDGWFCPQCKQNRDAIKKLDICRLPPVLVIHLKRFVWWCVEIKLKNIKISTFRFFASLDCTYYKKQNYVHFPINNFDISDYVTNSVKQRRPVSPYNLFAVSNHYGTLNRGHYTAFCKNYKSKVYVFIGPPCLTKKLENLPTCLLLFISDGINTMITMSHRFQATMSTQVLDTFYFILISNEKILLISYFYVVMFIVK